MQYFKHRVALALFAALSLGSLSAQAYEQDKTYKITILHTNDHHGHFWRNDYGEYGLAAQKTLVDGIRKEVAAEGGSVLLLSGGDINTGVPESDLQDAEPDFRGMNLIGYAATMAGKTTAVFSLEMPKDQLAMRLLCADARVDMQSVRHGSLRDDDWISLSSALGPLAASNIYIDDTSGITPSQLRSRCRRLKMEHGLDMIMVDYLQLMSADGHVENRQNEVSEISRNLKSIAKELNVPVIAEGGVWERGYGDYEWRGYVSYRVMPWYFFLQSGNKAEAFGVHTQPAAMCWWTAESTGYSVYLDVRCGGLGVRLNGRTLCAAELCRAEYEDDDGFTAMGEFFSVLSPNPILPKSPVYGANNWYHAYGHATEDDVLREAKALAELTEGLANRPWFIIDDCWQIDRADNYNGGPWRAGNKGFPDMPGLAKKLYESGIQPGIWVRLLWDHSESIPASWRSKRDPAYLDPSVPEVLDHIAEDIRTVSSWGYKLIKHDFTSYDVLGRWGFEMGDELTDSGWRFADETRNFN